jgi:hypothetical protein
MRSKMRRGHVRGPVEHVHQEQYLADVLIRVQTHPTSRLDELL